MSDSKWGDIARDHWPVVAAIAAGLIGWGTMTAQLDSVSKGQDRMEVKLDRLNEDVVTARANQTTSALELADVRSRLQRLEARR